ncbi:MAG: hypothetical protein HHJ09_09685 [Glaciimonas sp.]|nr:hypothetical protein [Glaciimonas sp.]
MSINGLGGSYSNASSNVSYTKVSGLGQPGSTNTTMEENSATTASTAGVIVNISDSAKAASAQATEQPSFKDVGMAARAKLDVLKHLYADKTGTTVSSVNVQLPGVINYSLFSDQDLAAMDLNSSGNFSQAE